MSQTHFHICCGRHSCFKHQFYLLSPSIHISGLICIVPAKQRVSTRELASAGIQRHCGVGLVHGLTRFNDLYLWYSPHLQPRLCLKDSKVSFSRVSAGTFLRGNELGPRRMIYLFSQCWQARASPPSLLAPQGFMRVSLLPPFWLRST